MSGGGIRVLVAEDSRTVRELLVALLAADPEITVVGEAETGLEALALAETLRPDVVTMDINLPALDGLEATRRIMERAPTRIIIVSSAVRGQAEASFEATRAGALAALAKPEGPGSPGFEESAAQLLRMVHAMSTVKVVRRWARRATPPDAAPAELPPAPLPGLSDGRRPRLVAIAASTGGPAALHRILGELPRGYPLPILVVQHIAPGFVGALASWLDTNGRVRVQVAREGQALEPGHAYVAPDGRHLAVRAGAEGRIALPGAPPVGGFRPSGTVLFESVGEAYGGGAVGVILTGMGSDGVAGLARLRAAGGLVLAQDEASSVIYGMPREAVAAGVVHQVLPVGEIAGVLAALSQASGPASPRRGGGRSR